MENRRVVVTGIGAVSPLGNNANSTWESMKAGRSGINLIESMDTSEYPVKIGGEIRDFDHTQYFSNPKDARRMDRYAHLSIAAAQMALAESGLAESEIDRDRVGVMLGSGIGGLGTLEKNHTVLLNRSLAFHHSNDDFQYCEWCFLDGAWIWWPEHGYRYRLCDC
jgi:3-oxoacyl-[acyl-carrier-protein] synthase II